MWVSLASKLQPARTRFLFSKKLFSSEKMRLFSTKNEPKELTAEQQDENRLKQAEQKQSIAGSAYFQQIAKNKTNPIDEIRQNDVEIKQNLIDEANAFAKNVLAEGLAPKIKKAPKESKPREPKPEEKQEFLDALEQISQEKASEKEEVTPNVVEEKKVELVSQPRNWKEEIIKSSESQLNRGKKTARMRRTKSEPQRDEFVRRFKNVEIKPKDKSEIVGASEFEFEVKKEKKQIETKTLVSLADRNDNLELKKEEAVEVLRNNEIQIVEKENDLTEEERLDLEIERLRPAIRSVVYNLAYFANDNLVLRKLIEMGVMIRKWDEDREVAEFVIKLDLERDVKPRLIFLHDIKIPPEKFSYVITKNPMLFKRSLDDLNSMADYLRKKGFDEFAIRDIVCRAPKLLSLPVSEIDNRLGWLQKEFDLSGDELRDVVSSRPKLITLPAKIASDVRFCLKNFLSFDESAVKLLMKTYPKLFTKDYKILEANYNYITQVIKLKAEQILSHPPILQAPLFLIKTRYSYLKSLKRDQFDPTLPNFVSVKNMIQVEDKEFVKKYAKTSMTHFQNFLKTI